MNNNIIPVLPEKVKPPNGQCARVLRHLKDFGSITARDAMQEYGIMRLAARVANLKKMGYTIESKFETSKNRYGENVNYVRYSMREKDGKTV